MAVFSVNIDDADVGRVISAMCANYGYEPQIDNPNWNPSLPVDPETNPQKVANPETQSQFANRMTRDYLMSNTVAYELRVERENVPKPTPPNITDPN
mgnify:FL=1|tara:strand:- start:5443 stop:5733 length:291 start_codon:yes stop_codon:yes gene_type:complete